MSSEQCVQFDRRELEHRLKMRRGTLNILAPAELYILGIQLERADEAGDKTGEHYFAERYDPLRQIVIRDEIVEDARHNARVYNGLFGNRLLGAVDPTNDMITISPPEVLRSFRQLVGTYVIQIDPPDIARSLSASSFSDWIG